MQLVLQVCRGEGIFEKSDVRVSNAKDESVTFEIKLAVFHGFRRGDGFMLKCLSFLAGFCGFAVVSVMPVSADDTGMAQSLHDVRREGRKLCIVDHWHYGSGVGATKKAAMADAVGSWQSFTALEYGTDWARFQKASSRTVSCANSGGGGVSCSIDARPCR